MKYKVGDKVSIESENKKPLMGRIVAIDKDGNESEIMTGEIRSTGGIDSGAALPELMEV